MSRSALPIVDAEGRLRGWRGTARDITAQIDAQSSATRHDELLRKLAAQIPGMIFQFVRHADGRRSFPPQPRRGIGVRRAGRAGDGAPDHAFEIVHPRIARA